MDSSLFIIFKAIAHAKELSPRENKFIVTHVKLELAL